MRVDQAESFHRQYVSCMLIGLCLGFFFFFGFIFLGTTQAALATSKVLDPPKTYCNPMNLDYAFVPDKDYSHGKQHRSTADPVCIMYKGLYYLFSTNQEGYWWSSDLNRWHVYWDSSYPIYGAEIDPKNGYAAKGKVLELLRLDPKKHGWERFGEDNMQGMAMASMCLMQSL